VRRGNVGAVRRQRGVALVIVLWILLLVSISTGAYTLMARMDQLEAYTVLATTRARMAAEAGMNFAVLSLRDPDELTRIVPDGRPYAITYGDTAIEVQVTDERGKIDINATDQQPFVNLLTSNGMDDDQAGLLAAAIKDWSDADDIERADGAEARAYEDAGLEVGPANRNFIMVDELLQVIGMPWELYVKMEPGLTVFSNQAQPDPAYAPAEALMGLPDMSEEDALNFVQERQSQDGTGGVGAELPNGQVAMARGRGLTYSILAKATLPSGVWDQIEATIRLGGGPDGQPFRILRWREGFHE